MKRVKDLDFDKLKSFTDTLEPMENLGGFQGNKIARAVRIIEELINDRGSLNFLSFPACLVATGIRGIFKAMLKRKWFDVVLTTCGTLDHDLARTWGDYYQGSFNLDDEKVKEEGYSRLGNVLVPDEVYADKVEKKIQKILAEIHEETTEIATYELVWELGKRIQSKESILYWAYQNRVPVVIPGITDGMVGYQLWMFSQDKDFKIDILKDEQLLNDKVWNAKRSGGLIIGGGISKHHTIWWAQFNGGLDYAIYLTSAVEWDGSLSGARPKEAVSWDKINEKAKKVFIWGEASAILPLMISALIKRRES